jgi:ferredoxin
LAELAALVKAVAIAELEIDNNYREAVHDPVFARVDANALGPRDLAWSPAYLVNLAEERLDAAEAAALLELLGSELPVKVVMRIDDVLGEPADGGSAFSPGGTGPRLSRAAIGFDGAFALQAGGAQLYRLRAAIERGLKYRGPALFSIFTGARGAASRLPPYLVSAAAVEARAFPVFVSDPSAGADWASRFSVAENAQAEANWPVQSFTYEDREQQKLTRDLAFTFADFVACDRRYASHFATVPSDRWDDGMMVPVNEYLELESDGALRSVPYLTMLDGDDVVRRVVVDDMVIHAARRCAESWRGLRELGGIANSHARRLVESERRRWEEERGPEASAEAPAVAPVVAPAAPPPPAAVAEEPAPAPERPPDEPYIETPRCTTCDECTEINNRLFVYDDNKQAYIADADAGSYRELVEAAESCQVAIVHPGKPRNPDEPGLDELMARAAAFA